MQLAANVAGTNIGNVGDFLTGAGTLVLAVGTIFAALMAVNSYRAQVTLNKSTALEQQGRWLMDLQKQFINEPTFRWILRSNIQRTLQ